MFELFDTPRPDRGIQRRHFLKIGGMAAGGLSLPQLLAAEAAQGVGRSRKAIINIFLPGGPPHVDMFDMKPDAPREIRGEFKPIRSNVPGMEFCELFPKLAKCADKFAIIRSLADCDGRHDPFQCMTGRKKLDATNRPPGGWPNFGAWVSALEGSKPGIPANLALMYPTKGGNWGNPYGGGFIGNAHAPMNLVEKDPLAKPQNLSIRDITLDRIEDRAQLRESLQDFQRRAGEAAENDGLDIYHRQALDILSGSKLTDALDLSKEDPKVAARYGVNDPVYTYDGPPKMVRNMLIALRLVEAGARVVTLNFSRWDWHGTAGLFNFKRAREDFPMLDAGLSALFTDLHERGLDRDVAIVVWGEFGRTPRLNKLDSRDHWPGANTAIMAGGGMSTGQVIGATDKEGGYPTERPVKFQEVFATLYRCIGIDPTQATVTDATGRPQYLVDAGIKPIRELAG
ncbi:MAG: DUF1501 domain-containing protein [Verrucomicrobiae bacterium]|nr:DUF1501 domain-containing protein [Verrucomicrobiae bacterium]